MCVLGCTCGDSIAVDVVDLLESVSEADEGLQHVEAVVVKIAGRVCAWLIDSQSGLPGWSRNICSRPKSRHSVAFSRVYTEVR